MGLFSKRCSVCGRKLPDKRKFKGVCDFCGMNYKTFSKQMSDTITIVKNGKNAVTCYNRCLLGLQLTDSLRKYEEAELYTFPAGSSEAQKKAFLNCLEEFRKKVQLQNEKRKYSKKVGLAAPSMYQKLYGNNNIEWKEGYCKACRSNSNINSAGYCFDCICRATSVSFDEQVLYAFIHKAENPSKEESLNGAIKAKLLKEKYAESNS